jgi:hypothetical protein
MVAVAILGTLWFLIRGRLLPANPVAQTVDSINRESAVSRAQQYYRIVKSLDLRPKRPMKAHKDFAPFEQFIDQVIEQYDFAGLVELEKLLDKEEETALWWEVARVKSHSPSLAPILAGLLRDWGGIHPDSWELFEFQPNAVELLLKKAEESKAPSQDRYCCIHRLYQLRAFEALPRLRQLCDDTTMVGPGIATPGPGPYTIGDIAKEDVARLEALQKETKTESNNK